MAAPAVDLEWMKKRHSKRYMTSFTKLREEIAQPDTMVTYERAFEVLEKTTAKTKFDMTVDVAVRLGVDPKQADQNIRGAVTLPHGLGKSSTIVVFAKGDKQAEAKAAGADHVGAEDLVEKILGGFTDFTAVVATPDVMGVVSKLGRVLGPKGLMPNPKIGTVTFDLKKTIEELKKGRVEFRVEKAGIVQCPVGKLSFGAKKLGENFHHLMEAIVRAKPNSVKGAYIVSCYLSTAMGPSVKIDTAAYVQQ